MELRTEAEMQTEFNKRRLEKKPNEGSDGYILGGEEIVEYKGLRYKVMLLRYFTYREGFQPLGSQRVCEYHAVVEYPEDMNEIVRLVNGLDGGCSEFLYHDTLHSFNDLMNVQEQIECCHNWAHEDIDGLPEKINAKLKELEELKNKLGGMNDALRKM